MEPLPGNTALIVIDVQVGFDDSGWGRRNNPHAEQRIADLLAAWRSRHWPLFHVRHLSLTPGSVFAERQAGSAIKASVAPVGDEPVVLKHVNSAFIGTTLEADLRARGISDLVIVGLTTDHCVSTSIRMAANLGFNVRCVSDATATFERTGVFGKRYDAHEVHDVTLASLSGEFAMITDTAGILTALRSTEGLSPDAFSLDINSHAQLRGEYALDCDR
ncbi:MAG: cysteine hydrolase family protein [Candidatus Velthaea sp.]|jgi:nicotinamidase-related amidase